MAYEVKTKTMDAFSSTNLAKALGEIFGATPTNYSSNTNYFEIPLGNGLYLREAGEYYGNVSFQVGKKDGSTFTSLLGTLFVVVNSNDNENKTKIKYIKTDDLVCFCPDGYSTSSGNFADAGIGFFMCTLTGGIIYINHTSASAVYDSKNNTFKRVTPLYVVNNPTYSGVGCVRFFTCGTEISNPFLTHDDLFVYNDDGTIVKSLIPFTIDGGTYIPVMTDTSNNATKLLLKNS